MLFMTLWASSLSGDDPISAILNRDWAALGGWSLFVTLCILIVVGAFREIWVPGKRARRTEALLDDSIKLNKQLADQVTKLTESNELTQYVIGQVVPSRRTGHPATVAPEEVGP